MTSSKDQAQLVARTLIFFATFPNLNALSPIRGLDQHLLKISPPENPLTRGQFNGRDFFLVSPPPDCRWGANTWEKFTHLTSAKKLLASGYIVFAHVNIINKNSQKVYSEDSVHFVHFVLQCL